MSGTGMPAMHALHSLEAMARTLAPAALSGDAVATAPGATRGKGQAAVHQLLGLLRERGPLSTRELGKLAGLDQRQVWGRLKWYREIGLVVHGGGRWVLNDGVASSSRLQRAAELLRAAGWQVRPGHGASEPVQRPVVRGMETIVWISAGQRLPDAETNVLVFEAGLGTAMEGFFDGWRDDGTLVWRDVTAMDLGAVTHWAEMPVGPNVSGNRLAPQQDQR